MYRISTVGLHIHTPPKNRILSIFIRSHVSALGLNFVSHCILLPISGPIGPLNVELARQRNAEGVYPQRIRVQGIRD